MESCLNHPNAALRGMSGGGEQWRSSMAQTNQEIMISRKADLGRVLHMKDVDNAAYNPPVLIPPRVLPLLRNLAQHMVNAGIHVLKSCKKAFTNWGLRSLVKMMYRRYYGRFWNCTVLIPPRVLLLLRDLAQHTGYAFSSPARKPSPIVG
ncbi:hypothetical protein L1887_01866 [Cichorium endivia]|nr:hypothetical protein L1887_01866 [Cichorium endivia]